MRYKYIALLILLSFCLQSAWGQSHIDSLQLLAKTASGENKLRYTLELGNIYVTSNPDEALELGLNVLMQAKRQGYKTIEGDALILMGLASHRAEEMENALRYYNKAQSVFVEMRNKKRQIDALIGISEIYEMAKNPELAVQYLNKALIISSSEELTNDQIFLYFKIGKILVGQGKYTPAFNSYAKVLNLLNAQNVEPNLQREYKAFTHRQIGNIYKNLGQFSESLKAYKEALRIHGTTTDSIDISQIHREIGLAFFLLQQHDSSFTYFSSSYRISSIIDDGIGMIGASMGLGDIMYEQEKFNQAIFHYNNSERISRLNGYTEGQINSLVKASRAYQLLGDYHTSTNYLNTALNVANQKGLSSSIADIYRNLSEISEREGRYKQSLEFYKLWSDLRDSIYSEESGQKIAKLQILYEISQKDRENEILRQNSEIQELQLAKSRYQRLVLIFVLMVFLVITISLLWLYNIKRKEVEKQRETELRIVELNKELERRMISEIKKQEKQQLLLAQKSKLESLGTMAAGIAHEINQPLGGISMGLDNILLRLNDNTLSPTYLKHKVDTLFQNVDRVKRIIDHIRSFSRSQKIISFDSIDANLVISNSLLMVGTQFKDHGIDLSVNLKENMPLVIGDKYKLEQVVLNLLSNARHAVEEREEQSDPFNYKKQITVTSYDDETNVYISIKDNGVGISQQNIDKIYDPFFTTKKEGVGTGLGLSIAYGFIKDILGDIKVDSVVGQYTIFTLVIPKS
ncbi:MAG: hypothetical protein JW783_12625 [Bacteroidales bacterium]|nr:hypothetical protein [Bacteroidales bacterium]MBN2749240.1 hypothetical protein [Bacteroidales bacterium]